MSLLKKIDEKSAASTVGLVVFTVYSLAVLLTTVMEVVDGREIWSSLLAIFAATVYAVSLGLLGAVCAFASAWFYNTLSGKFGISYEAETEKRELVSVDLKKFAKVQALYFLTSVLFLLLISQVYPMDFGLDFRDVVTIGNKGVKAFPQLETYFTYSDYVAEKAILPLAVPFLGAFFSLAWALAYNLTMQFSNGIEFEVLVSKTRKTLKGIKTASAARTSLLFAFFYALVSSYLLSEATNAPTIDAISLILTIAGFCAASGLTAFAYNWAASATGGIKFETGK